MTINQLKVVGSTEGVANGTDTTVSLAVVTGKLFRDTHITNYCSYFYTRDEQTAERNSGNVETDNIDNEKEEEEGFSDNSDNKSTNAEEK